MRNVEHEVRQFRRQAWLAALGGYAASVTYHIADNPACQEYSNHDPASMADASADAAEEWLRAELANIPGSYPQELAPAPQPSPGADLDELRALAGVPAPAPKASDPMTCPRCGALDAQGRSRVPNEYGDLCQRCDAIVSMENEPKASEGVSLGEIADEAYSASRSGSVRDSWEAAAAAVVAAVLRPVSDAEARELDETYADAPGVCPGKWRAAIARLDEIRARGRGAK